MRVLVTGATGMLGRAVVEALAGRGDEVLALSRDADRAASRLGPEVRVHEWREPTGEPAPTVALSESDAVINLLGEPVAQRWTSRAKDEIAASRERGTRNLVAGIEAAAPRPAVLVSQSATGIYGPRADERVDESAAPARGDFLADVVVAWEREADAARALGVRVAKMRTGVVLSGSGGALAKMLPPFKLGLGGPVAGGCQYVPWVHIDDVVGALLFALDRDSVEGPLNLTAPEPVTNAELSRTLGRVLRRPAVLPVPGLALKLLYGEMSSIVTTGVRAVPSALLAAGYRFEQSQLEAALRSLSL